MKRQTVNKVIALKFGYTFAAVAVASFLPIFMSQSGYSVETIGTVMMVGSFVMLVSPLVGAASDIWSRNKLITAALLSKALGCFLYPISLFSGRAVDILGNVLVFPQLKPILVEVSPKKRLGSIMASLSLAEFLPAILAPMAAGAIVGRFGFVAFFMACSLFSLSLLLFVPRLESRPEHVEFKVDPKPRLGLVILSLITVFLGLSDGVRSVLYPLVFTQFYGLSASSAGTFMGIGSIGYVVSLVLLRKKFDIHCPKKIMLLSFAVGIPLSYLMYSVFSFPLFMVLVFTGTAAYSVSIPALDKLVASNSRSETLAFDMVFPSFSYSVGLIAGNYVAAPVNELFGLKGTFIAMMASVMVEALLLGLFYKQIASHND